MNTTRSQLKYRVNGLSHAVIRAHRFIIRAVSIQWRPREKRVPIIWSNENTGMNISHTSRLATSVAFLHLLMVVNVAHAAPTIIPESASNVTPNSATLNGYVVIHESGTTIYYQYGQTTSYGSTTPQMNVNGFCYGCGSDFEYPIFGLTANTDYHFRIVASDSSGTAYGADQKFNTSVVPVVTTEAASSITATSAQLNGYVNPNGSSTMVYFQFGLTPSYGSATLSEGIGTSAGDYGTSISNLSPNTSYYYRIVANNGGGTSYGGELTFTSAQAPVLSIAVSGSRLVLSWPATEVAFAPEFTTSLGGTNNWTTVTNVATLNGVSYQVTISISDSSMFYRLKK